MPRDLKKRAKKTITAVDLFCGAAGLSLGLQQSGISIAAGVDLDPACRYPFEKNTGSRFIQQDIREISAASIAKLFGDTDVRVLAGCAPCQPFSGYTTKRRGTDERWSLLLDFLRIALTVRPEVVTMENVPRLVHLPLWTDFVSQLEKCGYEVSWKVVDASQFGVCQSRRRLVLIASRIGQIHIAPRSMPGDATVRSAIANLPAIAAGAHPTPADPLHASRALTTPNLKRIRASRPAGTWRDWPSEMRVRCHKRKAGKTYPSVYGRMEWDKPAPTITTQFYGYGNGRFGHPEQDRALSLREGALLQSFPPDFTFFQPGQRLSFKQIGRLIGNAVPPRLARAIGDAIVAQATALSK